MEVCIFRREISFCYFGGKFCENDICVILNLLSVSVSCIFCVRI